MKHPRKMLFQVSTVRCVGFTDAVNDLGTHEYCGVRKPYGRGQVYKVLKGEHKSNKLLRLIADKRPDLFSLHFVCDEVREWYNNNKSTTTQGE